MDDEWINANPTRTIDGEWRECTPAERRALDMIVYECVRHPAYQGCGASTPDCIRRMVHLNITPVGRRDERSFTIKDNRRTR